MVGWLRRFNNSGSYWREISLDREWKLRVRVFTAVERSPAKLVFQNVGSLRLLLRAYFDDESVSYTLGILNIASPYSYDQPVALARSLSLGCWSIDSSMENPNRNGAVLSFYQGRFTLSRLASFSQFTMVVRALHVSGSSLIHSSGKALPLEASRCNATAFHGVGKTEMFTAVTGL